ncbi:MAG: hypothetical protein ACLPHI_09210 [Terriglobales bacterium]
MSTPLLKALPPSFVNAVAAQVAAKPTWWTLRQDANDVVGV